MVRGIERFREYFADHQEAFVIIGGVACDIWFSARDLRFRRTDDIDTVLLIEAFDAGFSDRFREFVRAGGYTVQSSSDGTSRRYRFVKPTAGDFPVMVELFSRKPENIDLAEGQQIVPISSAEGTSLSAILIDDDYYDLIRDSREIQGELPVISATALIPLKARAWLDLQVRREHGETVDSGDMKKHRNDVFRLALTLPSEPGPPLPRGVRDDLRRFVSRFPAESQDWAAIQAALNSSPGGPLPSTSDLLDVLAQYFDL